jgi:DNA-binding FrmR family transcriptional regulator
MVEEDKYCSDILTQVAAVRAAINKVGSLILEKHSMTCIENAISSQDKKKALGELAKTMQSFMKFFRTDPAFHQTFIIPTNFYPNYFL